MPSAASAIAAASWGRALVASNAAMKTNVERNRIEPAADLASLDDRALVRAFQAGRREAFDVIVVRHRRQVYHLCLRFVQGGRVRPGAGRVRSRLQGLQRFKGDASLATWIYRIAVNVCLNRVALKRPESAQLDAAADVDGRAIDPLHALLQGERAVALQAAIAKLPPKQKATLMLRVYQECSHEEIATALGSTVGAVKANFFHALGNLRRLLRSS
jgi:RNA polymerase sigma-70 factor (ECF subfamily)